MIFFSCQASPKDVIQIHTAIDRRVIALKRSSEEQHVPEHNEESCDNETNDVDEDDTRSDGGEARPSENEANQGNDMIIFFHFLPFCYIKLT